MPTARAADVSPAESAGQQAGQVVYDDGVLRIDRIARPPGLALTGEIDEVSYPALIRALGDLAERAEIHVDRAGVAYCDLAGLRAIIRLARPGLRAPRPVVLHQVPPQLLSVLRIVGWDVTPGLTITKRAAASPRELA
jgi:ABC-type transporter Mla MlaB component